MNIIRTINRLRVYVLNDRNLSFKAKGIFFYLFPNSDKCEIYDESILNNSTDGINSFKSGIKELIKYNYIIKEQSKLANGRFGPNKYTLIDRLPPT
jgi:hypothetical protein